MKITIKEPQALTFEEFEKLSPEEKLLLLPLMPPKKRFDFLTDSRDAGALVKASPVVDLIVTVKEVGLEGAGALLALCDSEQIQYFMDMDTWDGYRFDKERAHRYLMVLREWDRDVLREKFSGLDYEQQLIYFLGDFKVFLAKEDFDPDEGIPEDSFTIDGVYYISPARDEEDEIRCDEEKILLTKELLTLIMETDRNLYLRLVEGMRQELYSVLEEDLYRVKSSRITELGFYEYDDAIRLYSEPTNIKREIIPKRVEQFSYSRLPVRYVRDIKPLDEGLESIDERTALEILFEIQILINRLIVADRLDMFEIESLKLSSEKVKSLLRLGLEVMTSEMGISNSEAMKNYYVIDIFRHGYKKLKFIRDDARRIRSVHQYLRLVELPQYFEYLLRIAATNFAEIDMREIFSDAYSEYPQSLSEVEKLSELLRELEASLDIIIRCFDVTVEDIGKSDFKGTNIPSDSKPTLFNLLMTPVANNYLGKGFRYQPIKSDELESLCRLSFVKKDGGIYLSEDFLKDLEDNLFSKIKENNPGYQYARRIMGRVLEEFISELGYIDDFSSLKPEFISIITLRKPDFY